MNSPALPLILASASPRRAELMKLTGIPFQVEPARIREDFHNGDDPADLAETYAAAKARVIAKRFPDRLVVGADTIVVLDGHILGKPADREAAIRMLQALSGRTHTVITGLALTWLRQHVQRVDHVSTDVTFYALSEDEIRYYVDHYRPFDKAGSYGIQDWFAQRVRHISGCFYNVVGFPLSRFYEHYRSILVTQE